jgi:hypothetical protein
VKFETLKWSDGRLLEDFLGFDFSREDHRPSGALRRFLEHYQLLYPKALKLREALRDDLSSILTGNRYQPIRHGQLSGVASIEELLKKIERLVPRPMWGFFEEDRKVHMIPILGVRPEQRLYQIVLSLLIDGTFWRLGVCRYCGLIFFGKQYCSPECRERWHNRYTRIPWVQQIRENQKQEQSVKKAKRRSTRQKQAKSGLGVRVFEEYRKLNTVEKHDRLQRDRLSWIAARIDAKSREALCWDDLSKDQKIEFDRIEEIDR